MTESNKGMPHQCNAATLRGGTEESNLDFPALNVAGIILDGSPSPGPNSPFELLHAGQVHLSTSIHLNQTEETDLEQWDSFRAKHPVIFSTSL
jgi:hypothetical protein